MSSSAPLHKKIRSISLLEKVVSRLRSPLTSIPECKHLVGFLENVKYGYMATGYRSVAEALVYGVQYTVHADVPGDVGEFGCQTGRTAAVISAAMKHFRANNTLHLFDSFEGLPEAKHATDLDNPHVKSGVWGKGELKALNPRQLRHKCEKYLAADAVKVYEGWFSNSMPLLSSETKFAMLHIDCDLYSSTMDVLNHVFTHAMLSPGGVIFFDDWDCAQASNDHGERKAWAEICKTFQIDAENWGGYGWGSRKFIVHSYDGVI